MGSRSPVTPGTHSLDPTRPDELFDRDWYLRTYPDIAAETEDGWTHFVQYGELEGRSPGPGFDAEYYRRTHLPLEGERPFTHYVAYGRDHGHAPRAMDVDTIQTWHGIRAALSGRLNPVLVVGNDARSAGAPLLLLEIAGRLRSRGWSPVFLLKQGGPLFSRFAALGPTLIADEGWNLPALGAALTEDIPILANTAWGALLVDRLGVASRSVVLIHEMSDYLVAQDLLEPVGHAHTVVASMPRVQNDLQRLLPPGPRLSTIVPGLRTPTATRAGTRRVRQEIANRFGTVGPVYIGAGYADQRKGFDLYLETARTIAGQDASAVFVWLGDLGSWARSLADEAETAGLRLLLPGFRADAGDWYAAAGVYLLTSRQDPGPTTVMDAAGVGTPFVGLNADIGLGDLTEVIEATGEFVADTDTLAARAAALAEAESSASRKRRATFVRKYRSLDTYVDDVERVLVEAAPLRRPLGLSARANVRLRLAFLQLVESRARRETMWATRAFVRRSVQNARNVAPRMAARITVTRSPRLIAIAVAQTDAVSILPDSGIADPARTSELVGGDRAWLSSPRLLTALSERADLHILRDPDTAPWPLVRELESAAGRIGRVSQHDLSDPPGWVGAGELPPRPRKPLGPSAVPHPSVALTGQPPVRLARPLGIFVHAYYVDVATQIAARLALIDHPYALYVSTVDEQRAEAIRQLLPEATVRVFPNQGRDIAPKVFGFAAEHAAHDVVLHLHTKRSPHRSDLDGWLAYLLDCLLPSEEGIHAILTLFERVERVGMVSPALYSGLGRTASWGPNRAIAEVVTWGKGWGALPEDHQLAFAAGSMFWARSSALRPIQSLAIPAAAFSDSSAPDGTLAHAVERLIGVSCAVAGLDQVFVRPGTASAADGGLSPAQVARVLQRRRLIRRLR